ncbi:MAG: thioredoxin-disulfide reductase [Eubacteriales bacterium]|nr:thioredoxin-disulfide reductase [Eubacteriales bacterium]
MTNAAKPGLFDMVILGGGPAGFTAALYAARAGLSALVLEKLSPGGQMALSHQIDNYPGFEGGIDGFTLAQKMEEQALRFGAVTELAEVRSVELKSDPKVIQTSEGVYYGKTVVIATGAEPKKLGLPEEQALTGRGVNYCAACDGMFYRNKTVVVVGGGNSAAADALLLSRVAERVIIVHRRDTLRADKIDQEPLKNAKNVEFRWNSEPAQLLHGDRLTGIRIRNRVSGLEEEIPCDGVFISVGRQPSTTLFAGQLELNASGYVTADESTATSIPGVYAVGDVRTKPVRQVVTAVADGAVAVHMAEGYLADREG